VFPSIGISKSVFLLRECNPANFEKIEKNSIIGNLEG
jgi:hypothetical protein